MWLANKMETLPCDHSALIEAMGRAQELLSQLRAIVLPSPPTDRSSELVRDLFEDIFRSFTAALSVLQPCSHSQAVDSDERDKSTDGHKKRRKLDSWTNLTTVPHIDGYQWRKYGQKQIKSFKFQRSYYRCTHHQDQRCPATKTVQQKNGDEDPPKFEVSYRMQHTCKVLGTWSPFVMDSSGKETSCFGKKQDDISVLSSHQNKNLFEIPHPVQFSNVEPLLSVPITPVDTPPMEDMIPRMLSPISMGHWDFGMDYVNHFNDLERFSEVPYIVNCIDDVDLGYI